MSKSDKLAQKIQRFWEVCYTGGADISYHPTYKAALKEAELLKRREPGRTVVITSYAWPAEDRDPKVVGHDYL